MKKTILLILADDLTGALDTGIQFSKHKISTGIILSAEAEVNFPFPPEVLVINTNTRHRSPSEAKEIIASCARWKAAYVYKKTDSTLRGHIGAELEALMDTRKTRCLPFIPAYPALGRTTKGGRQYLKGKPLDETEMASDILNPVKNSFIPAVIAEESHVATRLIGLETDIPENVTEREIFVFDGETFEDLMKIAKELFQKKLLGESAGCAGFAEALMEVLPFKKKGETSRFKFNFVSEQIPILVISGSLHPVSAGQVKTAMENNISGFAVAGEKLLNDGWFYSEEAKTLTEVCLKTIKEKGICILGTEMSLGVSPLFEEKTAPLHDNVSGRLGGLVQMITEKTSLVLAVFGGDTLLGIMENMKYKYIKPMEEILPGVVLSIAEGKENAVIISKAGAFGEPDLILFIKNYITSMPRC